MFSNIKRLFGFAVLALALLSFGYGVKCLFTNTEAQSKEVVRQTDTNMHPENEGKMVLMSGTLTYDGTIVEDPDTGVRIKSPVLKRTTTMRQYGYRGSDEKQRTMYVTWDEKHLMSFTDRYGHNYSNPAFPSDVPKSAVFASDLSMNNGTLKIDKEFTKVLSFNAYVDFKNHDNNNGYNNGLVNVKGLPSKKMAPKYRVNDTSYFLPYSGKQSSFASSKNARRGIGDISISYKAYRFKEGMPEFTVMGIQKDGKLMKESGSHFYDYKIESQQELSKQMRSDNRTAMFGAIICGVLLTLLGFYLISG